MTQTIFTDRSRVQAYQRCKRLRYLEYHEGPDQRGLVPARKSSHLVVGGAVHAGMEVLLREGQRAVDLAAGETIDEKLVNVFETLPEGELTTIIRQIEDRAVEAALKAFDEDFGTGVELDPEEARQRQLAQSQPTMLNDFADLLANPIGGGTVGDSPIIVDFSDLGTGK